MLNEAVAPVHSGTEIPLAPMAGMTSTEQDPENYLVESRYGQLSFTADQVVTLAKPILGFQHLTRFGLARLPQEGADGTLLLLQSLEDANISFPCFGLDLHNPLIEESDLRNTYDSLGIKEADGAILCILTAREEGGKTTLSINLRAPIFVDSARRMAWQIVMSNPRYPIRHTL